jgi:hypothetical protein
MEAISQMIFMFMVIILSCSVSFRAGTLNWHLPALTRDKRQTAEYVAAT